MNNGRGRYSRSTRTSQRHWFKSSQLPAKPHHAIWPMNINYTSDQPCAEAFKALYDTTGWGPVSRGTSFYQDALDGSWCSRSAYFGGQLVGFVRVISDGRLHAFVTEMIVHPEFQQQGIGAALLSSILDDCRDAGIADVQLFSAKGKSLFYKKLGFSSRPEDAPGMQFKAAT